MEFQFVVILLIAFLNVCLGLLALLKNFKSATNRLIFLLSLVFASWSIFNYYSLNSISEAGTLFWIRMVMVATAPLGPLVLFLVYAFPYKQIALPKRLIVGLVGLTVTVSVLAVTPLVFSSVTIKDSEITPSPGPGILLYALLFFGSLIFATVEAVKKSRRSRGLSKLQLRYCFIGLIATFGLQIFTNFLLVLLNISGLVALGPSFSLIFVGFLTYSIVKHRLLDLRLVAARTLVYALILSTLALFYTGLLFFLGIVFFNFKPSIVEIVIYTATSIFIAITFPFIKNFFSKLTNKIFYQQYYRPEIILHRLTTILNNTLVIDEAIARLSQVLQESLHVKYSLFVLKLTGRRDMPIELMDKKMDYVIYGSDNENEVKTVPSFMVRYVSNKRGAVLYEDLSLEEQLPNNRDAVRLKQWMYDNAIGVIAPLYIKDDVIGFIIIGEKKNGDAFTSEDVGVLETFALQAAIGIENILLFMYSRDFNKQLSVSVEQATVQLKEKNKTLELLRKMDSIITTTLEQDEVCQKVVDTLSWELGYDIAYLSLLDQKAGKLIPRAIAHTPIGEKAAVIVSGYEHSFEVDVTDQGHPIAKVFRTGTRFETEHLTEVFAARVPDEILEQLHEIHKIRGIFVLPIHAKQRAVGTLIVTFPVIPSKVSQAEREILDEFVKEVGIALDNAMLYEEVKRTNQALIDTNKRLIELDRMKDEFVSIASHELRTPMTAINSYVWMALNKGGELPVKARDYLDKVSISTQRLISLVEDMLNVSRIESGRVKIELVNFGVTALIADVHEELQIKAHERSLELIFEKSEKEFLVHGDKNKTREVLTNLIGNALKFTDHGKVTTTVREHQGTIEVSVSDTGRGIAETDMQRLFTKFGRLENELSTIAQTQGTGLGLYICKKYMEAMHGEIGVESKFGEGSRFWFRLPKGDVA